MRSFLGLLALVALARAQTDQALISAVGAAQQESFNGLLSTANAVLSAAGCVGSLDRVCNASCVFV